MSIDLTITTESLRFPLTGIGYYTARLIAELLDNPAIDSLQGLGYSGYVEEETLRGVVTNLDSATTDAGQSALKATLFNSFKKHSDQIPGLSEFLRKRYLKLAGRRLKQQPKRLVHAPNYIIPDYSGPNLITVHDLSHIRYPETHPKERVKWLNEQLPRSIAQASRIICVSEFTREELIDLGLAESNKISVCHNGIDSGFHPRSPAEIQGVLQQWGLHADSYLLSVATLEPRKNIETLLDAYRALSPSISEEYPLVLTGVAGWMQTALYEKIQKMPRSHRVITTGYIARPELQALMSGAAVFAYPSLYEGFGLPVVEAMASGVPVVTSNRGALAEVTADSGYTVPPKDIDTLGDALRSLIMDSALRERYRKMGLSRAAEFTWRRCAEDTVLAYKHGLGA